MVLLALDPHERKHGNHHREQRPHSLQVDPLPERSTTRESCCFVPIGRWRWPIATELAPSQLDRPYSGGSFTIARNGAIAYTGGSALRPADPLQVTWGFYSPNASFCYPGGEGPLAA